MNNDLYTYIVRDDTGLAPNPFWGVCTLAVCTPNHQGIRVTVGDWIAGFLSKERGHRFLYAMEVDEILGLDEYYHDIRFQQKKPDLRGTWKERCGDNFYSRNSDGEWIQHRNRFHLREEEKKKDTRYARVFIGSRFWYLGKAAETLPSRFSSLVGGRGVRKKHDPELAKEFCDWVASDFAPGIHGDPNDNPDIGGASVNSGDKRKGCQRL